MLIKPVNLYSSKKLSFAKKISLSQNSLNKSRKIYSCSKNALNRPTTCYFRNDLNWVEFKKYIENKYSKSDKVNTYIWGCSDGSEAYSIAILFNCIENGSKFYPVKAMDIIPYIINENKRKQNEDILLDSLEFSRIISTISKMGYKELRNSLELPAPCIAGKVKIKDEVKNRVIFSNSDITSDLDKIDSSNPSIVMCRNMWPYINPMQYDRCAKEMYEKLAEGSIVVIGRYDLEGEPCVKDSDGFQDSLIKAGFKSVDVAQGKVQNYKNNRNAPILIYEK